MIDKSIQFGFVYSDGSILYRFRRRSLPQSVSISSYCIDEWSKNYNHCGSVRTRHGHNLSHIIVFENGRRFTCKVQCISTPICPHCGRYLWDADPHSKEKCEQFTGSDLIDEVHEIW